MLECKRVIKEGLISLCKMKLRGSKPSEQMMEEDYIKLEHVVFKRGELPIFNDLSLRVPRGKTVAIMGPSGTGKTTLLKLIGGQLKPDAGRVLVDGLEVPQLGREALFKLRRKMGMLFQSGALFTDLSVFDNVAFPLRRHSDLSEDMLRDLVVMKLEAVGLRGAGALYPRELSGGMQRRVALARAIALDPELVMFDEPFSGLDPIAQGVIQQLITMLGATSDITSIIVSHDIRVSAQVADYIYVIFNGQVIGEGTPAALQEEQAPHIRQFISGLHDGPVSFHYPASDYQVQLMQPDELPPNRVPLTA